MMNHKKIVFKLSEFPLVSETFIISQIQTALFLGYEVNIITKKLLRENIDLIESLNLLDKVIIEDYNMPKGKLWRFIKWKLLLVLHMKDLKYILRFYKAQTKFSLGWLYQWVFYKQFNSAAIFHVQYGTNKTPLDVLKKTGYLKPALVVSFHGHDAFFPINGFIPNNGYYETLFKYADLIIANTPYLANELKVLGCPEDKMAIVPVAVNTDFFYPLNDKKLAERTLKLITIGRLVKVKGHTYCIEVVRKLVAEGLDVRLTIIGVGKEQANLERLIVTYNLEGHVFMHGKQTPIEIREALRSHDVYLLLAVPVEANRRETQGLATLEAQACGLPVIVFDSGGVKYTVQDGVTGYVCKEYDIDAVVVNIKMMQSQKGLIKTMGNHAVDFVAKHYSQKSIDETWRGIYKRMLEY